ncbi:MAG: GNAT family N-acetyltransferase [Frankia sp.]
MPGVLGNDPGPAVGRLTVREARPAEFTAVGELTAAAYGSLATGAYRAQLDAAATRADHAVLLVAELDGRMAGTVTLVLAGGPYAEISAHRADAAEFRMLAVDPSARGHGVGECLVRACLDRARAAGLARMMLCTMPEMTSARRLYSRLGFVRRPDLDWEPEPGVFLLAHTLPLQDSLPPVTL